MLSIQFDLLLSTSFSIIVLKVSTQNVLVVRHFLFISIMTLYATVQQLFLIWSVEFTIYYIEVRVI